MSSTSSSTNMNIYLLISHLFCVFLCCACQNLSSLHQIARVTVGQLKSMHEVLSHKEKEVVQSQTTARGLTTGQHTQTLQLSGARMLKALIYLLNKLKTVFPLKNKKKICSQVVRILNNMRCCDIAKSRPFIIQNFNQRLIRFWFK